MLGSKVVDKRASGKQTALPKCDGHGIKFSSPLPGQDGLNEDYYELYFSGALDVSEIMDEYVQTVKAAVEYLT
jgi:hypothetical protein